MFKTSIIKQLSLFLFNQKTFAVFCYEVIENRYLKKGSKIVYIRQLNKILSFKIFNRWKDINTDNIQLFNKLLKDSNYKQTYINNLNRLLSGIINEAICKKHIKNNPYNYIKLARTKNKTKKYIEENLLQKIEDTKYSKKNTQYAADLFTFCSHTGISFADLFSLNKSQIITQNDKTWLIGNRVKTNENYTVFLDEKAIEIINKYTNEENFLFKKICIGHYNKLLKDIAKETNLTINLSSHKARHI